MGFKDFYEIERRADGFYVRVKPSMGMADDWHGPFKSGFDAVRSIESALSVNGA